MIDPNVPPPPSPWEPPVALSPDTVRFRRYSPPPPPTQDIIDGVVRPYHRRPLDYSDITPRTSAGIAKLLRDHTGPLRVFKLPERPPRTAAERLLDTLTETRRRLENALSALRGDWPDYD